MHLLISPENCEEFLLEELRQAGAGTRHELRGPALVASDFPLSPAPARLAFARQLLPEAQAASAPSIQAWSEKLLTAALGRLPDEQPWQLHVVPHYGIGNAGENRCRLIHESFCQLLKRKRRHWLKSLRAEAAPFTPRDGLVQLLLTAPDSGFVSVAPAPLPHQLRGNLWPFPKGEIPVASDKAAPSRAFAKLVESEVRLGQRIAAGEKCVDLGASPGSWSYVALQRGAHVVAVDRSPLREDLMRHPQLTFQQGDAFAFTPQAPVDWLLCDVIAAPQRSIELLLDWTRQRRTRHFVVTIKFKGHTEYGVLERLKKEMPGLCAEFYLTHLCANKNEVCALGTVL